MRKHGYYDFKTSYQYPMSNGDPMEISQAYDSASGKESAEKKKESKAGGEETPWYKKKYIPPHLCTRKTPLQATKYHFAQNLEKSDQKGAGNANTM